MLVGIPAIFSSSMLGFSLFVGLLSVTTFVLAYRLGTRLVDQRLYSTTDIGAISLWEVASTLYSVLFTGVKASLGVVFDPYFHSSFLSVYILLIILIVAVTA
jgi:hypothetical protein